MGIVLYRKGNTHRVRDIDCELKVVKPEYFTGEPERGWFISPEEAYGEVENGVQEEIETEDTKETEEEVLTKPDYDKMSNKEIRSHAEKANIKNYKNARIQKLVEKLKAL